MPWGCSDTYYVHEIVTDGFNTLWPWEVPVSAEFTVLDSPYRIPSVFANPIIHIENPSHSIELQFINSSTLHLYRNPQIPISLASTQTRNLSRAAPSSTRFLIRQWLPGNKGVEIGRSLWRIRNLVPWYFYVSDMADMETKGGLAARPEVSSTGTFPEAPRVYASRGYLPASRRETEALTLWLIYPSHPS